MNFRSEEIRIFPLAKSRTMINRDGKDADILDIEHSRLVTEFNMSNYIRQFMGDAEGFILYFDVTEDGKITIKFNLHGYYMHIETSSETFVNAIINKTAGNRYNVYVGITIDNKTQEINGQDEKVQESNSEYFSYKGLTFDVIEATKVHNSSCTAFMLLFNFELDDEGNMIIQHENGKVINPVVKDIAYKFINVSKIRIEGIDGKH